MAVEVLLATVDVLFGQIEFQLLYTLQNHFGMNRFRKEIEDEAVNMSRAKQIRMRRISGEQNDLAARKSLLNEDCGINSADFTHDDVADQNVGLSCLSRKDRFAAAVHGGRLVALLVKDSGKRVSDESIVVGDQYVTRDVSGLGHFDSP